MQYDPPLPQRYQASKCMNDTPVKKKETKEHEERRYMVNEQCQTNVS
jgi:hypothetical protein